MKKVINYFSLYFRGREVGLDEEVGSAYLSQLILLYFFAYLRGFFSGYRGSFLFKNCNIICKNKVSLGKGTIINNNAKLNGMGKFGIVTGNNVAIGAYSQLIVSGSISDIGHGIEIGNNVGIGEFSYIGGAGLVTIGDDTIIGQYFSCHPENHFFSDTSKLIRLQGVSRQGISIGKNCWIGSKVTILDGAVIGDNTVIAAGSVVRGLFTNNVVLGGIPAKIIKVISDVK
ncbi:DapH/DapD/GlmU-related protein [Shewanella sp. H8]|uniref:acyltransferase n=1 Tax=Shewanella sp. H8 TaxID=3342676 RepID=UPI0033154EC8